ncbi:MAG: methyltransferase domain-containing protein [Candidatus Latescibacteria bacterium]|nr:methyltransferase domain-containing protein [Candidatus Latescibacterota bacterium]NIM21100.1 methyltransferase domain-containing protein [Candidatus Latescibacterota bacterium]NIM65235.1 methyltransferase domain-containing protein [Candidatus Latescibacterota bacterium]NIO01750.1 methyltransferase domain-containing protein [Candidatus Latescibacterota bacterium]NIO28267.1 methyltransferase domain-containing protein [Candidatus Latescibacterota bacterium]
MKKTSEKKHWDEFWKSSKNLDDVYSNEGRIAANLEKFIDLSGMKVLEVGAGTGRDSDDIASRGAEVFTLDYSEEALKLMQDWLKSSTEIVCGDARAIPFADEVFDVVFHQGLLEHFRDPETLLLENKRVLKDGGTLLIDVPQRFHYYTLLKHAMMLVGKWFAGWETEFSPGRLKRLVEAQGFEVIGVYGENLFPPIWYRALRRILIGFGLKLSMYPWEPAVFRRTREFIKRVLPDPVILNTSMIIGCIARKV